MEPSLLGFEPQGLSKTSPLTLTEPKGSLGKGGRETRPFGAKVLAYCPVVSATGWPAIVGDNCFPRAEPIPIIRPHMDGFLVGIIVSTHVVIAFGRSGLPCPECPCTPPFSGCFRAAQAWADNHGRATYR
jgi:hypothetical protein